LFAASARGLEAFCLYDLDCVRRGEEIEQRLARCRLLGIRVAPANTV
jgi:hypothetical protein